jgi:hypothetical protein
MSIALLSGLFLLLSGGMAIAVLGLFSRYLEGKARAIASAVFLLWLLYAGVLGYNGIIALRTPPGAAFLLVPVLVFLVTFLVWHPGVKAFASRIPVPLLIGLQVFRVFVELALYELYRHALVPKIMTFEAGNLDILVGLSAPVIAWLYATRRMSDTGVRVWSVAGLILLANIVGRALLTFVGVIQTDIPNLGIGLFPFTFLPGFLAPLALYLHVLLLRALPQSGSRIEE